MRSVIFEQANIAMGENQEEYETLYSFVDPNDPEGKVVSCFELNKEEIEEIVKTGKLWFIQTTFQSRYNPILISTENPFI